MQLTNYKFFNSKNLLYIKPVKGLRGYSLSYGFAFNGKEVDNETQTQDYGFRIYDYRLGRFLSVDPLTSKFPMLTPYQFASNTPIQAIDLDGMEAFGCTSLLYSESGASIGLGPGLTATISAGSAFDMIGKTHFTAYSALNPNNQDIYDGSKNSKIIYGAEVNLVSTGFNIIKSPTFDKAFSQQSGALPASKIGYKLGVGAGVSFSSNSFGLSVGLGVGAVFKTGSQSNILQSISMTYAQSDKVDALKGIAVTLSEPIKITKNGEITFESSVLVLKKGISKPVDSGIKVFSKSKEVTDEAGNKSIVSDGKFKSENYRAEETKVNKNGE